MNFSQRIGLEPVTRPFQTDHMDQDLRVGLWNAFDVEAMKRLKGEWKRSLYSPEISVFRLFFFHLWTRFFNLPADTIPHVTTEVYQTIRRWFFDGKTPWNKVYEFVEFVAANEDIFPEILEFKEACNRELERLWSGYRFVGGTLAPLTDKSEIEAIEKAASLDNSVLAPVTVHIRESVKLLSNKSAPDFRNSMKESILAVEAICKILANKPDATLTPALKALAPTVGLHQSLVDGFKSLYGYSSDTHGIRHALKDEITPEAEDAKYFLVSCSAFVNYLTEKARKAGLLAS